jgi:hypothetical protein
MSPGEVRLNPRNSKLPASQRARDAPAPPAPERQREPGAGSAIRSSRRMLKRPLFMQFQTNIVCSKYSPFR